VCTGPRIWLDETSQTQVGGEGEMTRRSDRSDSATRESGSWARLDPLPLDDASRKRAAQGASVVTRDDASSEPDLLTDAQLAVRWQLSRGTLANQRSQGRGPAYLKLAGRIRYRRSDIEAYEQAGFVSREPAGTNSFGDSSDVQETVARLIRSLGS
jgi:Helix-turn-helix domain